MSVLDSIRWPADRLPELVEAVGRAAGLSDRRDLTVRRGGAASLEEDADDSVGRAAGAMDVETEMTDVSYADVPDVLQGGPAIVEAAGEEEPSFVGIVRASPGRATVVGADGRTRQVRTSAIVAWLRAPLEHVVNAEAGRLIELTEVPQTVARAVRQTWFDARLGGRTAARCWMLRPRPDGSWRRDLRHVRLARRFAVFVAAYMGAAAAPVIAWWIVGRAILDGQISGGTIVAWTLVLLSFVPFAILALWSQGVVMIGLSGLVKQRLLTGALRLDPDRTRQDGFGRHLARVIESNALESLAFGGGFAAVGAGFDLLLAAFVFGAAGAWWHLAGMVAALAASVAAGLAYAAGRRSWTDWRMRLTDGLVERMIGHRTRLAQEPAGEHAAEDAELDVYVRASRRIDRIAIGVSALPRVWLAAGVAAMVPAFVDASGTMTYFAVVLGGTLLAYGGFAKLVGSVAALCDASISWRQVRPLIERARPHEPVGDPAAGRMPQDRAADRPLIVARDLSYGFEGRREAVLTGCSFDIAAGDRIHLTAPSGAGKSTLVSLLTGLRRATSGLLLIGGLDRATLGGERWRRRVAAAPQFHENHLFNDTLAFNLLLGRRWPPSADDLRDAELICHRLQLGELLERMPAGLFQQIGEHGWQLSHGERSRVFMARAVLQDADVVVLDESFAELDPDSLERCLPEIAGLSRSLLVVGHR